MVDAVVDAVIFDWGGTLTPWHAVDFEQEALALARAVSGVSPGSTAEVADALRAAGDAVWARSRDHHTSATVTDLREGVDTLPTLLAKRSTDPADARLLELLGADLTDDGLHAEALELLRKHPAMDEARAYVLERAAEARKLLTVLPEGSPVRAALDTFADIVATRTA